MSPSAAVITMLHKKCKGEDLVFMKTQRDVITENALLSGRLGLIRKQTKYFYNK